MANPLIPPTEALLTAMGPVSVYLEPTRQAEKWFYSERVKGHPQRAYQNNDPLGKSLGETANGSDGDVFLKVEVYRWVSDGFFGHARRWSVAYLVLSEEGQTWARNEMLVIPASSTPAPNPSSGAASGSSLLNANSGNAGTKESWFKKYWWVIAAPLVVVLGFVLVSRFLK
jgi:hypothetical protein